MPNKFAAYAGRVTGQVREFTIAQKTIAIIGLAVLILGASGLAVWMSKPSLTPLFSGLEASDANAVVEQLRTDGIAYELTDGSGTILVPEQNVYDQRLKAAAAGLPAESGTGGYSLLDTMGVTSSEFQQSVTYKRAIEGELAATIGAMQGVKTASVKLAIPEETVFVAEKQDPTASVFVETQSGVTLNDEQVQAIVHLTSASVEGMKAANISVIDSKGAVLSAVGAGAAGTTDKQATQYEERTRTAVQAMLDRVLGPGNATVAVAADMSKNTGERLEETFTSPENAPALNESSNTETYTGTGGGAAGVLGPDNIAVPGGAGEGTFNSEESTRNNALNKVTETTAIPAGNLTRQTVSVALDARAAAGLDRAALTALVSNAAGIDAARGDAISVEVVPFSTAAADEAAAALAEAEAEAAAARNAELLRNAIIGGLVILALVVAAFLLARRGRAQTREPLDLGELPEIRPEIAPAPSTASIETVAVAPFEALPAAEPSQEVLSLDRKRYDIGVLAATNPEKAAEFLRGMMEEKVDA